MLLGNTLCSSPWLSSIILVLPGKCLFIPQNPAQEKLPPVQSLRPHQPDCIDPVTAHELSLVATEDGPLLAQSCTAPCSGARRLTVSTGPPLPSCWIWSAGDARSGGEGGVGIRAPGPFSVLCINHVFYFSTLMLCSPWRTGLAIS